MAAASSVLAVLATSKNNGKNDRNAMFLLYLGNQQGTVEFMRVECPHCREKAIISSTNSLSPTVKDLYCVCTNVAGGCAASFVMKLGYSHDLNPPVKSTMQMAASLLKSLSPHERQALLQGDLFTG